jgi:EPS-associated MarR family transcriptional regulator
MHIDEIHYRILKAIEEDPSMSQRDLAAHLGVSLGKTNYCLRELVKMGWVKAGNFKSNPNKGIYAYLLTPSGVKEKARITMRFLQRKMEEYGRIKQEIARLQEEVEKTDAATE